MCGMQNLDSRHKSVPLDRGVYDTTRAAALSGVPVTTINRWARQGVLTPSIAPGPRTRLWSWADLLLLRTIRWYREDKGLIGPSAVSLQKIRQALEAIEAKGVDRRSFPYTVFLRADNDLFLPVAGSFGTAVSVDTRVRQSSWVDQLNPVRPYHSAPDLLSPGPHIRIIPGKLHGEPHILDTRLPTSTVFALSERGYDVQAISELYRDVSRDALSEAIEFERSLTDRAA